jgi:outer membrane protein assembly factor BamB
MIDDGIVYAVSSEGTLHAIDFGSGAERWSAALDANSTGSPLLLDGHVLVATDDGLTSISMADGAVAWNALEGKTLKGSPVLANGHVVVAAEDGSVSAVEPATGSSVWTTNLGVSVDTSSAASADTIVVGTATGEVVAIDASNGASRWRTDTGDGARVGTPAIGDDRVYIATLNGGPPGSSHIRQLDLGTGAVLWTVTSPDSVPSYSPAIVEGMAITEGESGVVMALDTLTGAAQWVTRVPGTVEIVPAISGRVVYAASNDTEAFALDAATGTQLWRVPIEGTPYGATVSGGLMLFGTDVGKLYAIGGDQS